MDKEMIIKNGKKKIISERVGILIASAGMTQNEFADILISKSGKIIS